MARRSVFVRGATPFPTKVERKLCLVVVATIVLFSALTWWSCSTVVKTMQATHDREHARFLVNTALMARHLRSGLNVSMDASGTMEQIGVNPADGYEWTFLASDELDSLGDFETRVLRAFEAPQTPGRERSAFVPGSDRVGYMYRVRGDRFDFYQPIYARSRCAKCHQKLGLGTVVEGDLMAAAKITLTSSSAHSRDSAVAGPGGAIIAGTCLVICALCALIHTVVGRPLVRLHAAGAALASGDVYKPVVMPTADEFEDLGNSLNLLARSLSDPERTS